MPVLDVNLVSASLNLHVCDAYTETDFGSVRAEEVKKKMQSYLELDRLLEDRGTTGGLVLCPETVLRHHTVTEGWDLERQKKRVTLRQKDTIFNLCL